MFVFCRFFQLFFEYKNTHIIYTDLNRISHNLKIENSNMYKLRPRKTAEPAKPVQVTAPAKRGPKPKAVRFTAKKIKEEDKKADRDLDRGRSKHRSPKRDLDRRRSFSPVRDFGRYDYNRHDYDRRGDYNVPYGHDYGRFDWRYPVAPYGFVPAFDPVGYGLQHGMVPQYPMPGKRMKRQRKPSSDMSSSIEELSDENLVPKKRKYRAKSGKYLLCLVYTI